MPRQLIIEQIVVGEDSLDDLNTKVNDYISNGYQPKDPMLEIRSTDGSQYHYTQTMVKYIPDPQPDDLGSFIVKYIKLSGADAVLDQITDDQWKLFRKNLGEAIKEFMEEHDEITLNP